MLGALGILCGIVLLGSATAVSIHIGHLQQEYGSNPPSQEARGMLLFYIALWAFLFVIGLLLVTRVI
jgi:F0F1-type ATP synthase membrane subunit c/vacuolar-type H+-ATPase subunit K